MIFICPHVESLGSFALFLSSGLEDLEASANDSSVPRIIIDFDLRVRLEQCPSIQRGSSWFEATLFWLPSLVSDTVIFLRA